MDKIVSIRDSGWPSCQLIVLVETDGQQREVRVDYERTFMGDPTKYCPTTFEMARAGKWND